MDIHKPKPWHGVREFLKEYVIIVVGVLTALGAEQGVEWLHWHHQLEFTEGALQREVRGNLISASLRTRQSACGAARLAHLSDALRQQGPGWKADPLATLTDQVTPTVYQMPVYRWGTGAWQTALGSGVLNHMAPARLASYASIFNLIEGTRDRQTAELAMTPKLGPLAFDLRLDGSQRTNFMSLVAELDALNGQMARRGVILDREAIALGIRLSSKDRQNLAKMTQGRFSCLYREPPPEPS